MDGGPQTRAATREQVNAEDAEAQRAAELLFVDFVNNTADSTNEFGCIEAVTRPTHVGEQLMPVI